MGFYKLIQCGHGFILLSKVRKMDCQNTKHIGILYHLVVERAFRMLKGRFKILLKRVGIPLCHMLDLVMACICLHNMCIVNLDGFNIDWALEAQKDAQIETNTTFRNLKKMNFFKVAKEAIKQMRRLQNPRMVDGDDRNDMDDMEHQGETRNHVLTTMEKNPNKKNKKINQKDVDRSYGNS
jgi:hypothetical protein